MSFASIEAHALALAKDLNNVDKLILKKNEGTRLVLRALRDRLNELFDE